MDLALSDLPASRHSEEDRLRIISAAIEELRPSMQADGGDLSLVSMVGRQVRVRLGGSCCGCAMATETLGGIRRHLTQALGEPVLVLPAR